jgi:hypothetical protein
MRPSFPTIKVENEGYQVGNSQEKTARAKKAIVDTPVEDMPTDDTMPPFVALITIKVKEEAKDEKHTSITTKVKKEASSNKVIKDKNTNP